MPQPKHVDVSVDLQQDEASLFPQAVDLCQALLPQWASLPEKDIKVYRFVKVTPLCRGQPNVCTWQVTKVSGGITNMLLKLTPSSQRLPVLVRVFGDHTDEVIDRDSEETISLQLHEAGFGAEVK